MYNLSNLTMSDMTGCGKDLRNYANISNTMEESAGRVVEYLYENMRDESGAIASALTRLFVILPYKELPGDLQSHVQINLKNRKINPDMMCLTLLGTRGVRDEWNFRRKSQSHLALPLTGENFVRKIPMLSALIDQLGLNLKDVLDRNILYNESKTYNIFYVENAQGNPLVPAQEDFVILEKIQSVIGFGGALPSGKIFVFVNFSKVSISRDTANLFRPLALSVISALMPFEERIFN